MTLDVEVQNIHAGLDASIAAMKEQGLSPAEIDFTDKVLRPAFVMLATAKETKQPVPDVDEALVAVFASTITMYLRMIFPANNPHAMRDHLRDILHDVSQRVKDQIKEEYNANVRQSTSPSARSH